VKPAGDQRSVWSGHSLPALPGLSTRTRRILNRSRYWAVNVAVASFYFWFAKAHFLAWLNSGDLRGLGVVAIETVVAVLILTRRAPIETSGRLVAWVATVVGIVGPMLARPTDGGWTGAMLLQLAGAAFAFASLFVIGRSFGLVAANRGIVTRGPYGLVRHPIYLGYVVANLGYLLENPSSRNAMILGVATFAQLVRISCEEDVLSHDPAYSAYRTQVRYRLIPHLY
jgi:protein-S-isoprenylcysteine O-methyltransferase Ste14